MAEENILMIRCSKCGEMNKLPVVHCKKCGAKLDFEAAEKTMIHSGEPTPAEKMQKAAKLALTAVLAVIVLLMIWPGQMTRTTGEPIDAKRYRVKVETLVEALNVDIPSVQEIAEADANAHLKELLAAQPERKGWSPALEDIGVRFFPGRAEVFVATARGPFTLTALYQAKVVGGKITVTGARAGHLPLPGILGQLYAKVSGGMLKQLKNESRVLRNMDGASIGDQTIEILVNSEP